MVKLFQHLLSRFRYLCWCWLCLGVSESQRKGVKLSLSVWFTADDVIVFCLGSKELAANEEWFRISVLVVILRQTERVVDCDGCPCTGLEFGLP